MSNVIKKFANIIANFIDRTFLPILNNKVPQGIKAITQWNQFKAFINESQTIEVRKVQQFIMDLTNRKFIKQISMNDKYQNEQLPNNLRGASSLQSHSDISWRLKTKEPFKNIQKNKKEQNNLQSPSVLDSGKKQVKSEIKTNQDLFQNLIPSFRKLCENFQNNHKKLITEHRESFSLWVDSYQ